MGLRVKEEGASERRPVMGRIGVAHDPARKGADFPLVSAGVNRQPTGVGCEADMSARSQGPLLVLQPPPIIISVAGPAAVTLRWTPRPMGRPRPVRGVVGRRSRTGSYLAGTLFDA
jgi:hypothetical protein